MAKEEKKRLSAVIRATEYLFLENIALKLVLDHRAVPNWQSLLERLLSDKEMLAGVHLKFRRVHAAPAPTQSHRMLQMQHLVVDDVLEHIGRHCDVIEDAADDDRIV